MRLVARWPKTRRHHNNRGDGFARTGYLAAETARLAVFLGIGCPDTPDRYTSMAEAISNGKRRLGERDLPAVRSLLPGQKGN